MANSTGPPNLWQKLDDQMKRDSERTARVVGRICGLRVPSPAPSRGAIRRQGYPRNSRSRNRRGRKRRIFVIEESTKRVDRGVSPSLIRSNSVSVSNQRSQWWKWIWLMVLFVIFPELFGYLYVGFIVWVCGRSLYHYFAALDRLQRR